MRVTCKSIHAALQNILPSYEKYILCPGVPTSDFLKLAVQEIFVSQIPEDDDTRLIRRAFVNLTVRGCWADDDADRMEARRRETGE